MKTHRMRAGRGGDEFKSQTLQINMRHSNRFTEMGCYKLQRHKHLFWLIEKNVCWSFRFEPHTQNLCMKWSNEHCTDQLLKSHRYSLEFCQAVMIVISFSSNLCQIDTWLHFAGQFFFQLYQCFYWWLFFYLKCNYENFSSNATEDKCE